MLAGAVDVDGFFSKRWLLQQLEKECEQYRKMAGKYPLKSLTSKVLSEDQGYMSRVYLVQLEYGHRALRYCLKVPTWDKLMSAFNAGPEDMHGNPKIKKFHNNEVEFYDMIKGTDGFLAPKVYSSQRIEEQPSHIHPHILMEFCEKGRACGLEESLTWPQLESAAHQIAILHAFFIGYDRDPRERIMSFDYDTDFPKGERDQMHQFFKARLAQVDDAELLKLIEARENIGRNEPLMKHLMEKAHLELGVESIFCHGDLWGNNIIYETDSQQKFTGNVAGIIDFQMINMGNPAQDLARLLVLNCSPEVRRASWDRVYREYHSRLTHLLRPFGKTAPFTADQLIAASYSQMLLQINMSLFFIAVHFQGPEKEKGRQLFYDRVKALLMDEAIVAPAHFSQFLT